MITGVPCGLGEPLYDSIESKLSHFLFSIPGLKGVTFGDALDMAKGFGSEMNDLYYKENKCRPTVDISRNDSFLARSRGCGYGNN